MENESKDSRKPKYGPKSIRSEQKTGTPQHRDPKRAKLISLARQKNWPEPTEEQLREVVEATKHYDTPGTRASFGYFIGLCHRDFKSFPNSQNCREFEASLMSYDEFCCKRGSTII